MNSKLHKGHFARKRFGQNFLNDEYIITNIVNAIAPKDNDNLIEIGPGLGAITFPLLEKITHLTVIEIDRDLVSRFKSNHLLKNKLTVIEQDAMSVDFSKFNDSKNQKLRIFGNLPYNISTPLLFHLFNYTNNIRDMHFMLQKEVVDRLVAAPNSKLYGRLSVMAQYYCRILPVLEVTPLSFTPSPKVNSAVVKLIPHEIKLHEVNSIAILSQIVTAAFSQRRKTIRNSLSQFFSSDELSKLNLNEKLRAENLSLLDFCMLTNNYAEKLQCQI